jgi:hypothetical protein
VSFEASIPYLTLREENTFRKILDWVYEERDDDI